MAVWSVIQKSQLECAIRLDSEYYQPEYLTLMDSLKKKPTVQLNSIAFVTDGIHASIDYDNKVISGAYRLSIYKIIILTYQQILLFLKTSTR